MSWDAARKIAQLIQEDRLVEIKEIMSPYSLEQRRCITSIKYKRSSLLFVAVVNHQIPIIAYLLGSCGADPNNFGYMGGKKLSCLSAATCIDSETVVKILLTHGADTELTCTYQTTALLYACIQTRLEIAKCLIANGADVNAYNRIGESCLVESINNIDLFEYLISMGADVNSVGACGQTVLMLAIEGQRNEIISFLLGFEDTDVRLENDCLEDAFCLALRHSSEDIIDDIVRKGGYTKDEVIQACEFESCLLHVRKYENQSNELWEKALKLREQSNETSAFGNHFPGKLETVIRLLNTNDAPTLKYLESVYGLNNALTLQVYTKAARNVRDVDKYIVLCEFFFNNLHSLDDRLFFGVNSQTEQLIQHYFGLMPSSDKEQIVQLFNVYANYAREVRARFERMTPRERMPRAHMMECFLYFTIEFIELIYRKFPKDMHLFHEGIRCILTSDLRGLSLKTLTQMCGRLHSPVKIMSVLFYCRANVNSSDIEGKTVLHEVIESVISERKIVDLIINNGFDFRLIKCKEYCLPCRMERMGILPNPVEHISLQCLAARTFCEKAMICSSDVPPHLMAFVNSHLYIP